MAWELHICKSEDDLPPPLGASQEVRAALDRYFDDIRWKSEYRGECDWGDGIIEFSLDGEPVTMVMLTVRTATDPSLPLVALGKERQWLVVNESTSDLLEDEEDFSPQQIKKYQQERLAREKQLGSLPKEARKRKLPKIKQKKKLSQRLNEILESPTISCLFLLPDGQVTDDIWNDYFKYFEERNWNDEIRNNPRHSCEEVHLPDGKRFGVLKLWADVPERSRNYLTEYFRAKSLQQARLTENSVLLDDGTDIPAENCLWIRR